MFARWLLAVSVVLLLGSQYGFGGTDFPAPQATLMKTVIDGVLNINGKPVPQKGYITDELTDYALEWLGGRDDDEPFFLYLSHKAVHAEFRPAERHRHLYADVDVPEPVTQADTEANYAGKPMWVKNQRNSWHGVDFPYHSTINVQDYLHLYHETLLAVDDSIGRVMAQLRDMGIDKETLVIYMGDNGFMFGEHGLIDKRVAYETYIHASPQNTLQTYWTRRRGAVGCGAQHGHLGLAVDRLARQRRAQQVVDHHRDHGEQQDRGRDQDREKDQHLLLHFHFSSITLGMSVLY